MSQPFSAAVWNVMHDTCHEGPEFGYGHLLCEWCAEPLSVDLSETPVESDGLWHHARCWERTGRG